jgi:hypothetical protein
MRSFKDSRLEEIMRDYGVSLDMAQGFLSMERHEKVVRDGKAKEAVERFYGMEDQEKDEE